MELTNIGTVYGTLLNFKNEYYALSDKMDNDPYKAPPKAPVLYIKPRNTFSHTGEEIIKPGNEDLMMGGSIGIVFGRAASRVKADKALDYVRGYVVVNDVTLAHDNFYRPAYPKRARDGFLPIGDYVDADKISDINNLTIEVSVNDITKHTSSTSDLMRTVETLIADVSVFMTLQPNDMLLVGVDADMPSVKVGDVVRVSVNSIGHVENTIGGGIK